MDYTSEIHITFFFPFNHLHHDNISFMILPAGKQENTYSLKKKTLNSS